MRLIDSIKKASADLIERIFRRKRLAYLEPQNKLLADMNLLLTTGESVRLTVEERRLILKAIENPSFKEQVEIPQTRKFIRIVRNNVREKMRTSLRGRM